MAREKYAVGNNMPGYMPDNEPVFFSNWKSARDCFVYQVEQAIEESSRPHCYKIERETLARARKARKVQELQTNVDGQVYWLSLI